MPRSKKLSKNKKPIMVLLYGAPASGKYTTGKKLAKITGYKFLHSHAIRDLVFDFFDQDRENIYGQEVWESFYYHITEKIMREKVNVIFTHTHGKNRVYCNGLTSLRFVEKLSKIVKKNDGNFFPVHLVCEKKELMRRVVLPSRRRFNKGHSKRELEAFMRARDYDSPLTMEGNFAINNTRISASRTAKIIKDHFNL